MECQDHRKYSGDIAFLKTSVQHYIKIKNIFYNNWNVCCLLVLYDNKKKYCIFKKISRFYCLLVGVSSPWQLIKPRPIAERQKRTKN